MTRRAAVHIVEPGGRGGVHHHAAALAAALAEAGAKVVFWTAARAEDVPLPAGVVRRSCSWRFGGVPLRTLRRAGLVAAWTARGVPACLLRARQGDVVHIEGRFRPVLLVPLVVGARLRGCTVAFSPHTTFSRRPPGWRARAEDGLVRWLARRADVVFAFSDHDAAAMKPWGVRAIRVPLAIGDWAVAAPEGALVEAWRRRWARRPVVLFAGQLRHDKGLDLAVRAAAQWRPDATLAVVGEDLGALEGAVRAASSARVELVVDEGYVPLQRFVAAVAAADVVICPYRVASTSAVLAMAAALGRPTVATAVGGSPELATVTVAPDDPGALAAGVDKALAIEPPAAAAWRRGADLARPYLAAYG